MQSWIMALLTAYGPICDSFWWVKEECDYLSVGVCEGGGWGWISLRSCPVNECDSVAFFSIYLLFIMLNQLRTGAKDAELWEGGAHNLSALPKRVSNPLSCAAPGERDPPQPPDPAAPLCLSGLPSSTTPPPQKGLSLFPLHYFCCQSSTTAAPTPSPSAGRTFQCQNCTIKGKIGHK